MFKKGVSPIMMRGLLDHLGVYDLRNELTGESMNVKNQSFLRKTKVRDYKITLQFQAKFLIWSTDLQVSF